MRFVKTDSVAQVTGKKGGTEIGSIFKMAVKNFGSELESEVEVTAWDPPHQVRTRAVNGPVLLESKTVIMAQGSGSLVTYTSQVTLSGLLKLAEGLVSRLFKKQFETNLAALKTVLEGQ